MDISLDAHVHTIESGDVRPVRPADGRKQPARLKRFLLDYKEKALEMRDPDTEIRIGHIDYTYLALALVILAFGLVMVYSSSSVYAATYHETSTYYLKKQLIYILAGFAVTVPFVIFATPWLWKVFTPVLYIGTLGLLALVLVVGKSFGGARRWISLGGFTLQPSEIAKTAAVMMIALFMTVYASKLDRKGKLKDRFLYGVVGPGVILMLLLGLIVLEKHLSGLIIIGVLGVFMMLMCGTDWRWIAGAVVAGVLLVALVLFFSDYAQMRVNTWIHIDEADPLGEAWQSLQGLYSVSSGGLFGVGLGNSSQKFGYVSQPQNDFIFAVIAEELGFFGSVLVVGLFAALVFRGFRIAKQAPDPFTRMVAYGLSVKIAIQVILNIGVVTNLIPNTGISLPFFSSGGTSIIMQIFEVGVLLSISRFRLEKKMPEEPALPVESGEPV